MALIQFLLSSVTMLYLNMGLMLGLTFGALILLRPVTNRLLRPRHRVWLWCAGWYLGFLINLYDLSGAVGLLPVSFRSLLLPSAGLSLGDRAPTFLPTQLIGAGEYTVTLPGGGTTQIWLSKSVIVAVGVCGLAVFLAALALDSRQNRRLRRLGQRGGKLPKQALAPFGLDKDNIVVRVCPGLPTSFVRFGHDLGLGDGVRFVVLVQEQLSAQYRDLVLTHEAEHIRLRHPWWRSTFTLVLYLNWWNPIIWIAYRLTCRDMELACDEAVMERLEPVRRKEYAKALVELGAGKPIWGAMTSFGECDAALRIKNVVAWKPEGEWRQGLSWALAALMFLFFYCGGWTQPYSLWEPSTANQGDWLAYVDSPQLLQDLREQSGRQDLEVREIWMRTQGQLVIKDGAGEWYHCSFFGGDSYQVGSFQHMDRVFLDGYQQLA